VVGGHELGARLAVHVDELGEQELDPVVGDDPANVVCGLGGVGHALRISRGGGAAQWS
jgi:hypothetical protein